MIGYVKLTINWTAASGMLNGWTSWLRQNAKMTKHSIINFRSSMLTAATTRQWSQHKSKIKQLTLLAPPLETVLPVVVAGELLVVAGLVLVLAAEVPPANGSWLAEAAPGGVVAVDCPCVAAPKLAGDVAAVDCACVAAPRLAGEAVEVTKGFWLPPAAALPVSCSTHNQHDKTKYNQLLQLSKIEANETHLTQLVCW